MTRREFWGIGPLAALTACGSGYDPGPVKAIVGGVAIDPGGETVPNAVIQVSGARIRSIASAANASSVPSKAQQWNVKGSFLIPAPIELAQGVRLQAFHSLEQARTAMIKVPEAVEGVVSELEELPAEMVLALSKAATIVVPRLSRFADAPQQLAKALKHVKTLVDSGIRIASFGEREALREWRLLRQAGLTAAQVLESATAHAARVARVHESAGALRVDYLANIWILRQDPRLDVEALGAVESIMAEGVWQRKPGAAH